MLEIKIIHLCFTWNLQQKQPCQTWLIGWQHRHLAYQLFYFTPLCQPRQRCGSTWNFKHLETPRGWQVMGETDITGSSKNGAWRFFMVLPDVSSRMNPWWWYSNFVAKFDPKKKGQQINFVVLVTAHVKSIKTLPLFLGFCMLSPPPFSSTQETTWHRCFGQCAKSMGTKAHPAQSTCNKQQFWCCELLVGKKNDIDQPTNQQTNQPTNQIDKTDKQGKTSKHTSHYTQARKQARQPGFPGLRTYHKNTFENSIQKHDSTQGNHYATQHQGTNERANARTLQGNTSEIDPSPCTTLAGVPLT